MRNPAGFRRTIVLILASCSECFASSKCGGEYKLLIGSDSSSSSDSEGDGKSAAQKYFKMPLDFEIADVDAKLKAIRERLDIDCSDLYFYTRVLGGKWTA